MCWLTHCHLCSINSGAAGDWGRRHYHSSGRRSDRLPCSVRREQWCRYLRQWANVRHVRSDKFRCACVPVLSHFACMQLLCWWHSQPPSFRVCRTYTLCFIVDLGCVCIAWKLLFAFMFHLRHKDKILSSLVFCWYLERGNGTIKDWFLPKVHCTFVVLWQCLG